ncbi:hypothetical protein [Companilactobacillus musae]|uniref:hypothetical protein n=1 Tax=Companilactobacillus musae TaxID=1903258 RepID=UPI000E651CBD|nr:hypothetical protein [Companilactobacillus musae]
MKKYNTILVILLTIIVFLSTLTPVKAVADDSDALKQAPDGLPVSNYFSILNPLRPSVADTNYPFMHNSAKIDPDNKNIVILAKGNVNDEDPDSKDGAYGAAWSDMNKNNYIDITKHQTVSVWLYFGSGDYGGSNINGEGMALVLQNDPRKNTNNQSQALGAGYQGLGSLGYDRSTLNYSNQLWGLSNTISNPQTPTPDYVARTAIQNSVSLDFNAERNDTISGSGLSKNGPIELYKTPITYNFTGSAYGIQEYTLNGFDTVDTSDPYGRKISKDYPGYNDLIAQRPLLDYALRQGNSGGNGFGSISMTYPGNSLTYQLGDLLTTAGNYSYFTNKKAMSTVQAYTKSASLINGSDNNRKDIYWHHVTFTWNPAQDINGNPTKDGLPVSGGTPASITYHFNDKMPDGSTNIGNTFYQKVDDTIPVDPSQFDLTNGNTKVYWGVTGANSNDSNVHSKLAIFESIPALATAKVSSKIIDHSLNDQFITDNNSTVPERRVFNNDKLTFDYALNFDNESSHQNWKNIISKINLPNNDIRFDTATITYHTDSGQNDDKTEVESIPLNWDKETTNEIKHDLIHSLGTFNDVNTPNNYTSANIDFNGTAINTAASMITVNPEPAVFTGSNAIETTSSPQFYIENNSGNNKLLQLEVSKDLDFQNINYQTDSKLVTRKSPFILNVTSLQSPWILQVSSNGLFLNNTADKFNGNLVYKENESSDPLSISNNLKTIAQDQKSYENMTTDYLARDWTSEDGILLQPTSPHNKVGKYTGTMNWEVVNAPENNAKN